MRIRQLRAREFPSQLKTLASQVQYTPGRTVVELARTATDPLRFSDEGHDEDKRL